MRKFTFLFTSLFVTLLVSAQTKITFEDQGLNGAAAVYGGSVSVVANPVTTGINTSAYCLDVVDNGYAPIKFSNFTIPAGAAATYPYVKLKFKIAYKGDNGGTDLDYPQVDVYSSAASPVLDATEKLGSISSAWGLHTDGTVWKSAEFTMSASALSSIPNGILVLKVAKSKCEFLLDDIELIPSPIYNPDVITLFDFESGTIGDATTYPFYKYWSTTAVGTSTVAADPLGTSTKALNIAPTDYNGVVNFSVALPSGKTLANYDRLFYDLYFSAALYAQEYIAAGSTIISQTTSGYPSQGTVGVWNTKDYVLNNITSSNSFTLKIGFTSNNSVPYYLDNIKLHENVTSVPTGIEDTKTNALIIYNNGDAFYLSQTVDKVALYDMNGHKLVEQLNVNVLTVPGLKHGIYIVKSVVNNEAFINKVVK